MNAKEDPDLLHYEVSQSMRSNDCNIIHFSLKMERHAIAARYFALNVDGGSHISSYISGSLAT